MTKTKDTATGINPWHDLEPEEEYELLKNSMKLYAPDGTLIDIEATVVDPDWAEWIGDEEPVESGKDDDALAAVLAAQAANNPTLNNCGTGGDGFKPGNSCAKGGKKGGKFSSKTFFHGTAKPFSEFDPDKIGTGADAGKPGWYGSGFYLSGEQWKAQSYAFGISEDEGHVLSVEADVVNPLIVRGTGAGSDTEAYRAAGIDPNLSGESLSTAIRGKGYDSVAVLKDGSDIVNELVVFDPSRLKVVSSAVREGFKSDSSASVRFLGDEPTANEGAVPPFSSPREELEYWTRIEATLNNCGTGGGGFKPGNTCAKGGKSGGGGSLPLSARTFYHSTNAKSAKVLEKDGIDPESLNTRDSGFFGSGFYTSQEPQDFYGKSLVAVTLSPDAKVLEVGELNPKSPKPWHNEFLEEYKNTILSRRPDYPEEQMKEVLASVTPGNPKFSHLEYAQEVSRFSRRAGYSAAKFAEGQETVIFNLGAIESIKRVGGLASAKKHKSSLEKSDGQEA